MLYPKNLEQKLGFDTIKELTSERCVSDLGRSFIDKIRFSDNYSMVKKLIGQTAEFKLILPLAESRLRTLRNSRKYLKASQNTLLAS
ncbi:hypothetical protein [uncultured Arcticibacterium sp.]|uniref:hypothetical protein n=1 Tax=uncultured Arcticibacterium sp. TaxID=2173042 RepID=UPI0030F6201D